MYRAVYCTGDCEALSEPAFFVCDATQTTCYAMTVHEPGEPFDIGDLDPVLLGGAFSAGFILVGTAWAIGYGAKTVLAILK